MASSCGTKQKQIKTLVSTHVGFCLSDLKGFIKQILHTRNINEKHKKTAYKNDDENRLKWQVY